MARTALIVGAGIGGLSAAIALRRAGWEVRLFERAASPRELGFGLSLAPNAVAALRDLGVADAVLAQAFSLTRGEVRRLDGKVLKRLELPQGSLGGPMAIALRPAVHGALLEAAGLGVIALSAEVTGFAEAGDRVVLHFRQDGDDRQVEGDLLVGADGVHSVIRRALHPDEPPPRSSGIVAVRGAVHGALEHLGELGAVLYFGRGVEALMARASETGIYWYLSLARELVPQGMEEPSAILDLMAPRLDPAFRAVTMATEDVRFDALVDRDPLPFWSRGRVTLLGDAAHPLLPHTGQGAAQAMTDAVTLGKEMTGASDVEQALKVYERERRGRTVALLQQGRRTARLMRTTNPVACALRDLLVRAIPAKPFVKTYVRMNRRAGTEARNPWP